MNNESLGDRMKAYENVSRCYLTRRTPVIIRLDGNAFHTFTRGLNKPFDHILSQAMVKTCEILCDKIQGCKLAYTQSDEISLLLTDYENLNTDAWFSDNIQKMASISASLATLKFNEAFNEITSGTLFSDLEVPYNTYQSKFNGALFDSRVFNVPREDVCNYFVWRQKDAIRNSIQSVGQSYFSNTELYKKTCDDIEEMLRALKHVSWNSYSSYDKFGTLIVRNVEKSIINDQPVERTYWGRLDDTPIFTENKSYIDMYL